MRGGAPIGTQPRFLGVGRGRPRAIAGAAAGWAHPDAGLGRPATPSGRGWTRRRPGRSTQGGRHHNSPKQKEKRKKMTHLCSAISRPPRASTTAAAGAAPPSRDSRTARPAVGRRAAGDEPSQAAGEQLMVFLDEKSEEGPQERCAGPDLVVSLSVCRGERDPPPHCDTHTRLVPRHHHHPAHRHHHAAGRGPPPVGRPGGREVESSGCR